MPSRTLRWDDCLNVRDLGGHPTEDGGETRFGAVVRADALRRLSEAGWEAAVAYGVRTVVDLRYADEREADPPRELPVEVVHVSLFGDLDLGSWAEIERLASAQPDAAGSTQVVYGELLERHPANFAHALTAVARAEEGAVLVHCEGGKDRTGLVAALLLRLAGVSVDHVAADYALSGENLRRHHERWIFEAADEGERARRSRIAQTPAEAMAAVLRGLDARHGGAAAYLRGAGLGDDDLSALARRLRG